MKPLIPQTVYIPIDGFTEKQFKQIGILDMAIKKENQYIFTKEEFQKIIELHTEHVITTLNNDRFVYGSVDDKKFINNLLNQQ